MKTVTSKGLNTIIRKTVRLAKVLSYYMYIILIHYIAKRCRAERGQVIAVHNGVVKDLTNLPQHEQQRILNVSSSDVNHRPLSISQAREERDRRGQESPSYQLVLNEVPVSGQSTTIIRANNATVQHTQLEMDHR